MITNRVRLKIIEELLQKQPELKKAVELEPKLQAVFSEMCKAETPEEAKLKEKYEKFVLFQDPIRISDLIQRNKIIGKCLGISDFPTVWLENYNTDAKLVPPTSNCLKTVGACYSDNFPQFSVRKGAEPYWEKFIAVLKEFVTAARGLYQKQQVLSSFLEDTPVGEIKRLSPELYEVYRKYR